MTRTERVRLDSPSIGGTREVVVHGHWGRPVLWFPSEGFGPDEFADRGMLDALRPALDDGLLTVFCVPSHDEESWSASWKPLGDRARAHLAYENWIVGHVAPLIHERCAGRSDIVTAGPSMGAFHAVLFALRHAHLFGRAVALSGSYSTWAWRGWGEGDVDTYLTDPMSFLPTEHDGHLDHLRRAVHLTLVVGSGRWEDTTGANASTRALAGVLADKQIGHDLFVWGPEWPHDWNSWQAQAATYLPSLGG